MPAKEKNEKLARVPRQDFVGRDRELSLLLEHAARAAGTVTVSSRPGGGVSELLRQTYDSLLDEQGEVIPVYFAVKRSDGSAFGVAKRFLQQFLLQVIVFRRNEAARLGITFDCAELSALASPTDAGWISSLIDLCRADSGRDQEDRRAVQTRLSGPSRAASSGVRTFVMMDDVHLLSQLSGGNEFMEDMNDIFAISRLPYVLAGRRRSDFRSIFARSIHLENLNVEDAGKLIEILAVRAGVDINDQTRDLLAVQAEGNPLIINLLFGDKRDVPEAADTFQKAARLYCDELFAGNVSRLFDRLLDEVTPDPQQQAALVAMLADSKSSGEQIPLEYAERRLNLPAEEFSRIVRSLDEREFLTKSFNSFEAGSSLVLSDYITARRRRETGGESRAIVFADTLSEVLKRAPKLMARTYRQNSSIGLVELMRVFDSREIPASAIDYERFREHLKGESDAEISARLAVDPERVDLPQIIYAAPTNEFYAPIINFAGPGRCVTAVGFQDSSYREGGEVAWLAAEIDSKLEASAELAREWYNRLEEAASACNFENFRVWLIAPEGFDQAALDLLREKGNAYGSSRAQVDLLKRLLNSTESAGGLPDDEYELVVPMGGDTELIAAHAVEEILRRHNCPPKTINQIKTALVEACINAAEHSDSPDRKIYQKFSLAGDSITITVSNRGLRLKDKQAVAVEPGNGRRGWGLNLIKGLMDDVRIESVDDGTRIVMTKRIREFDK